MTDMNARIQRMVEEMTGNEALLQMLDTEAAAEMLNWGMTTAKSVVSKTMDLDDFAAELALVPRLKAIRQTMRLTGNWAAGKYADPASRVQLREKLLESFRTIFGREAHLPPTEKVDEVLNQVDDQKNTPRQLIVRLQQLLAESS